MKQRGCYCSFILPKLQLLLFWGLEPMWPTSAQIWYTKFDVDWALVLVYLSYAEWKLFTNIHFLGPDHANQSNVVYRPGFMCWCTHASTHANTLAPVLVGHICADAKTKLWSEGRHCDSDLRDLSVSILALLFMQTCIDQCGEAFSAIHLLIIWPSLTRGWWMAPARKGS